MSFHEFFGRTFPRTLFLFPQALFFTSLTASLTLLLILLFYWYRRDGERVHYFLGFFVLSLIFLAVAALLWWVVNP